MGGCTERVKRAGRLAQRAPPPICTSIGMSAFHGAADGHAFAFGDMSYFTVSVMEGSFAKLAIAAH